MASLKLKTVPASQGIEWVRRGFATLARRPMAFVGLSSAFVFVMALSLRFPFLLLLLVAALPMISLGFMNATRHVADPSVGMFSAFTAPLRPGPARGRMLALSLAYFAASAVIGLLSSLVYGDAFGALVEAQSGDEPPQPGTVAERMADPRLSAGMLVQLTLATLLSIPFWHAPALIFWGGQGVWQALFSSTIAVWRNRGAFVLYGVAFSMLVLVFMLVSAVLLGLLGTGPLAAMLALSISLVIPAAFYASLYHTFIGCFEGPDERAVLPPAPSGASPTDSP